MPASTFVTVNDLAEQLGRAVHNLSSHTFKVALSNVAPSKHSTVLADITQIANGGGYTGGASGGYLLDSLSFLESTGIAILTFADEVITAAGGAIAQFRYLIVYNDSAANDELLGWLDYATTVDLADTESLTVDLGVAGLMQITS